MKGSERFKTIMQKTPAPGSYRVIDAFSPIRLHKKNAYSMGVGRESFSKVLTHKKHIPQGMDSPGAKYNVSTDFSKTGKQISLKPKLKDRYNNNPGPGAYLKSESPVGRSPDSRIKNV